MKIFMKLTVFALTLFGTSQTVYGLLGSCPKGQSRVQLRNGAVVCQNMFGPVVHSSQPVNNGSGGYGKCFTSSNGQIFCP